MPGVEIRPVRGWLSRRTFVDVPFRIHGGDPTWVPPLRAGVYDRLSRRRPPAAHQRWELWLAYRNGRPVGRIGACVDRLFDAHQGEHWGWVGFFDCFDDHEVANALFDVAVDWCRRRGAERVVGPANFTTNDELGLLVEGFGWPAAVLTLENPPYYERLWTEAGWTQAMDLYGYRFEDISTDLSERQRRTLARLKERSKVTIRSMRPEEYEAEVGRLFTLYNAAWEDNWGFSPLPEADLRHLSKQLKPLLNPRWVFAAELDGEPVGVCITLPDVNRLLVRMRSGRLLPFNWLRLLIGLKRLRVVRVWALGIRPDVQNLALGPLMYAEIMDRLRADGVKEAEASWTLASNPRINGQLEALGGRHYRTWRLYQRTF
jgi:GNAT superfamily N-acetyltransferase